MNEYLVSAATAISIFKTMALVCFAGALIFAFLYGTVRPRLKLAYRALEKVRNQNEGLKYDLMQGAKKINEQERLIEEMRSLVLKAETRAAAKALETARNTAIRKKIEADAHRKNERLEQYQRRIPTLRQVV